MDSSGLGQGINNKREIRLDTENRFNINQK
jgi:hypothetical protein